MTRSRFTIMAHHWNPNPGVGQARPANADNHIFHPQILHGFSQIKFRLERSKQRPRFGPFSLRPFNQTTSEMRRLRRVAVYTRPPCLLMGFLSAAAARLSSSLRGVGSFQALRVHLSFHQGLFHYTSGSWAWRQSLNRHCPRRGASSRNPNATGTVRWPRGGSCVLPAKVDERTTALGQAVTGRCGGSVRPRPVARTDARSAPADPAIRP